MGPSIAIRRKWAGHNIPLGSAQMMRMPLELRHSPRSGSAPGEERPPPSRRIWGTPLPPSLMAPAVPVPWSPEAEFNGADEALSGARCRKESPRAAAALITVQMMPEWKDSRFDERIGAAPTMRTWW
uniref:Uncharacterized protein n=1 Tax=Oryza meridionalis TaxID=40149 RepID=A0A0E0DXL6_9ORYZ